MAAIDQIVTINISQQTSALPQVGFGIPLIMGPNASGLAYYSSAADMLQAGFTTGDAEYVYALEAFEQALSPTLVGIGERATAVAQVDTIAVNSAVSGHTYSFSANGLIVSFAAANTTKEDILTGLNAALAALTIPPGTGVVTGTGVSALLTITAAAPGAAISYTAVDAKLTQVNVTPNHGIQDDISSILNSASGDLWYGLALCSNVKSDILQAAALIETLTKIYIAASSDSNVLTRAVTTDVASTLKALAYKRTALMYSPLSANLGIDAGWLGGLLPTVPGSATWKFKQIVGVEPDFYTADQRLTLIGAPGVTRGKGCNIYEAVGGANITEEGWMAGGQFIDVTVGLDWLKANLQLAIYSQLINNPKVPYTDKGVAVIANAVSQVLGQASDAGGTGLLDHTTIVVSTTAVASIPANTRAQRILPAGAVSFTARLAGAFHFIVIQGIVTA